MVARSMWDRILKNMKFVKMLNARKNIDKKQAIMIVEE